MTHYFVSYDIADDRLRDRLAKLLQREGCLRVQRSVFLAPRFRRRELQQLRRAVHDLVAQHSLSEQDSIICLPVGARRLKTMLWEGTSEPLYDGDQKLYHLRL